MQALGVTINSIPYIPDNYICITAEWGFIYSDVCELSENIDLIDSLVLDSVSRLKNSLSFDPTRKLHICVYNSNEVARRSINRIIPDNMAMAPYHSQTDALVILHSPSINSDNADCDRMSRIIIHEICHVFLAEIADDTKILGDGNEGKNTPSWFDEGFAEYVALVLTEDFRRLEDAIRLAEQASPMSDSRINKTLDGLDSESRPIAFAMAVSRVALLVQQFGIRNVFQHPPKRSNPADAPKARG